jgi:hypothetical protein
MPSICMSKIDAGQAIDYVDTLPVASRQRGLIDTRADAGRPVLVSASNGILVVRAEVGEMSRTITLVEQWRLEILSGNRRRAVWYATVIGVTTMTCSSG